MLKDKSLTYISLFSSAGVGCYGFKKEGFHCIATNEIIERRLAVQKANDKCELDSGYICGDLSSDLTKKLIYDEIKKWDKKGNDKVDVVMATPPCQGISVINHKKNDKDIKRNSLVINSIEIVKNIKPRFFVFENVQAFEKTLCMTNAGEIIPIGECIRRELGEDYTISSRIMNFMNYGSNSSRTRTLVIGVLNSYRNNTSPYDLFPTYRKEKTLREVIGNFDELKWGEISTSDFYHAFRTYDRKMRDWIHDLKEGESAFDNEDPNKRPHRIINGKRVENIKKNRDKYTRQKWDRFVQCVHTRNDQLAAQNTIHPTQDRVFSVREIMEMMTVPNDFRWVNESLEELNALSLAEKRNVYKENEVNIRQCLGEAVPTEIIRQVAHNIKTELAKKRYESAGIGKIVNDYNLSETENLIEYIKEDPENLGVSGLQRIVELSNAKRLENAAFYTNKFIISMIMDALPSFNKDSIRILEPSVGAGGFLPLLFAKYENVPEVIIDAVDIDENSIKALKELIKKMNVPSNVTINLICEDFLFFNSGREYDLAVGNPPYSKLKDRTARTMAAIANNVNKSTYDLAEIFLEKCIRSANYTALVLNKTILSSGEYSATREWLSSFCLDRILDFGRYGFSELSIETICLMVDKCRKPSNTKIFNLKHNMYLTQDQKYITDAKFPYYVIYRNDRFDKVASKLNFGVFDVFRDRQITKKNTSKEKKNNFIRVIKARNISDSGEIEDIAGYDTYIDANQNLAAMKYVDNTKVYLTPNMTYKPRVIKNVSGIIPDGSVAVLIPKGKFELTERQLKYFSSEEYREFYIIARNLSTQSINVDKSSVFFYGVLKNDA